MTDLITFLTDLFSFDKEHPLLFTQFNFWAFFLLVFAGYCFISSRTWKDDKFKLHLRNGYLFIVSLFFYFKTSGLFVLLLVFSTFLGYLIGIRMDALAEKVVGNTSERSTGQETGNRKRKAWMIAGVVVNLLVLFYFKYAYFFTDIYNNMFHTDLQVVNHLAQFANHFTEKPRFDASKILLPVGISFFTFQNISYIVDVYKRKIPHASNVLDFGFYTTFFPQLVAGPIVRADQFIPQLYKDYHLGRRQFGIAVFWIVNGLMKKIILSDYLAVNFVDRVFDNPSLYTGFENLSALFIYSLQVYADFSGYTDIAIGVAMLMGFYLPQNFNSPYKATNPAGFWKRWHMSLSNWLKDYLYIPLGGNRRATAASYIILGGMLIVVALMAQTWWVTLIVTSVIGILLAVYLIFPRHRKEFNTNVNNMDTMLLGGMWHGASFNFITWGGLNGLGILAYKWWKKQGPRARVVTTQAIFALFLLADLLWPTPALNLFTVWSGIMCVGTIIRYMAVNPLCDKFNRQRLKLNVEQVWNIFLTFVFITFTRLFFRSGSNLDPAEANEVAWNTAKAMVERIGGAWDLSVIPGILSNYSNVFLVFLAGMVIHWLPEHFKRRYRLWFAMMPLWLMLIVVVLAVVVIYQFITADLQPFIYFQF
ncbi:MAG: MBOAT family protein [Bacteroidales bacterium]|nr:MBOAT family protein [Bacteroidales bacterium]